MSTAVFDVVQAVPGRMAELALLIDRAREKEVTDEPFYDALCRSCAVLLASHLEGYLKDLTRALVLDMNFYVSGFSNLPNGVKRNFCLKIAFYEGVEQREINERAKQIQAFFESNSVDVDFTAFKYRESTNKNPTSSVIDSAFEKLGLLGMVESLSPCLDGVFNNDPRTDFRIRRDLTRFRAKMYGYPYARLPTPYQFSHRTTKRTKGVSLTLWETFIQEVMARRHRIAHGDTMENEVSWEELGQDVGKMHVLMHGLAFSAASALRIT